jgi:peptide deformylase
MPVRKILIYPQDEARLRRKYTLATQAGAGLAAPQIGVLKRVVLVKFGQDKGELGEALTLINPIILESGPIAKGFDGCLSIPGLYTWDTLRPSWLTFSARDENWKKIEQRVEGIDAIVVHHEIDHLNGVLFLDRMEKGGKLYVPRIDENGEEKLVELSRTV